MHIPFELGTEGGVFNIVNMARKAVILVIGHHATALGTQVGVVVRSEEHVKGNISFGDGTEKSTHIFSPLILLKIYAKNSLFRVMGSMY